MLAPSLGRWGPVDIYGGWNVWGQSGWREREGEKGSHKIRKERRKRGCNEGFSGCLTRPWHDMPPAGWNGFPSGCQGNLWSTPPASTLWLYRLNSRAQPRCPHHTHCYTERTRIEKFGNVCASAHASSESWTPHCCERPCWIHYQHSPHSLLLLFSRFLFSTTLDDERMIVARHWLLLIECQNFLKYIRRKRSTKFGENLWKKSCLFLRLFLSIQIPA